MEEAEAALEGVPSSMIQRPFYPSVSSAMLDGDGDGKTDVFYFTVQFPIENTEAQGVNDAVVKVCIMPEFDYEIYANPRSSSSILARPILFKAAPVICVSNQNSLKVESLYATIKGDLKYYQTKLIEASRYVRYDKPGGSLFNEFPVYALASMSPVAAEYARQNISALFTERFASFDNTNNMMRADEVPASVDTLNMFTFSAELRVLDAVVQYVPAWDEMPQVWMGTILFKWLM